MEDLTGRISGVSFSLSGKPLLTLEVNEKTAAMGLAEKFQGKENLAIRISAKKKRSLDANAYCWALIGKIAEKTRFPKSDVYRRAIREIGGNCDIVCVKKEAAESLRGGWEHNGLGWMTEVFPSKLPGCVNVCLYYGSSVYDTAQMSRLIDSVIQECNALGIETKPQEEIDSLIKNWR